jgi:hypothetical protein
MNFQEIYEARLKQQTPQEILEQQELTLKLQDAADLEAMQRMKGYKLLATRMEEMVSEARSAYEDSMSSDEKLALGQKICLQVHRRVVKGIQQYVDEMVSWRTGFLNPEKEPE